MLIECSSCLKRLNDEDDMVYYDEDGQYCEDCAPEEMIERGNVCGSCDEDFLERLCLMCQLCEACCECGHEDD